MYIFFAIVIALLGVCVGSFLNVVVLRHNTGLGISRERSMCFSCGRQIAWYENIPVVSFIALRGRCRRCRSRISLQYPLIEILTGALFLGTWLLVIERQGFVLDYSFTMISAFSLVTYYCALLSLLIIILVYDFKHKIIPNAFVYTFAFFALIGLIVMNRDALTSTAFLLDLSAGPVFFLPFYLLWYFSKGRWIGLGDGKLALGIGWMLGLVYGLSAIILAFWIGAVVSLLLIGFVKINGSIPQSIRRALPPISLKSEIPFAPFLILGVIIEFFWKIDIIGISLFF